MSKQFEYKKITPTELGVQGQAVDEVNIIEKLKPYTDKGWEIIGITNDMFFLKLEIINQNYMNEQYIAGEDLKAGRFVYIKDGKVYNVEVKGVCKICQGEGVVPKDEFDEDSKTWTPTGEKGCECQNK